MEPNHPIDAEIRAWLKKIVPNKSAISLALGHGNSWLHKYVNGDGHATLDDLVRIAGLVIGLNLPVITETERRLLKACQGLEESDQLDVMAYAEHRARLARRGLSKESSAPATRTTPATASRARGRRKAAG